MELAFLVYGLGLINNIHGLLVVLAALVFPVSIIAFGCLLNLDHWEAIKETYRKTASIDEAKLALARNLKITKRLCISMVVSVLLLVTIPSERTAYMMVGAYAVQTVASHPSTIETSAKVLKLINIKLDEFIK